MKKTKFVLAASLAVLLSACGQQESETPAEPQAPATTTPAPTPTEPAPTTPPAEQSTTPSAPPAAPTPPAAPADSSAAPAAGAATASAGGADGAAVYNKTCSLCHAAGVAGAPKPGNKEEWGPRIAQGKDTLYKHAIEGFTGEKGMMPPRGGGASLTDEQVKAAVDYMVAQSQ